MSFSLSAGSIIGLLLIVLVVIAFIRAVQIILQPRAFVVKRLREFHSVTYDGLRVFVPFVDCIAAGVDLHGQVTSFQSQPAITMDNIVAPINSIIHHQITDPMYVTYEIVNFIQVIEWLIVMTLRNVTGSLDLKATLTGRNSINTQLRNILDKAAGRWGIYVNRVELKAIDSPPSIQHAIE